MVPGGPQKIRKISIVQIFILQIWSALPIQEVNYVWFRQYFVADVLFFPILLGLIGFVNVHILNEQSGSKG
jgi:hypothetical protein